MHGGGLVELVLEGHTCLRAERTVAVPPVVVFFDCVEKVVRGFSTRGGLASIWWTVGVRMYKYT